ncbi:MAG: hypothetical protein H0W89_06475 [Candidatus Levybacteria bacterium]|nr:hypothetical protein [Candidatus Levybacteria bacterium]
MQTVNQNLQVKLTLDEGLKNVWNFLTREYEGLDKSGIVRLALNNLAKTTKRQDAAAKFDIDAFFKDLDKGKSGMTENEFAKWWNKNKNNLV